MSKGLDIYFNQLKSKNDDERYNAFQEMMKIIEECVNWVDDYKNDLIKMLEDENSYQRTIGIMLLCNLAKNDKEKAFRKILDRLMLCIDDDKFITQRQYIQNIWKVAIIDDDYKEQISKQLESEFVKCIIKPHFNLIRLDIVTSLKKIALQDNDKKMIKKINEIIESEEDLKNKKKMMKTMKEKVT